MPIEKSRSPLAAILTAAKCSATLPTSGTTIRPMKTGEMPVASIVGSIELTRNSDRKPVAIADGASIKRYIEETAAEDGTDRRIRFHHRVVRAEWSSRDGRWTLDVERGDPSLGAPVRERLTCGFLFACTGYYRYDRGYQIGRAHV